MGDVFSWFLHQGIVRVLSVPIGVLLLLCLCALLAAPPPWSDDEDGGQR